MKARIYLIALTLLVGLTALSSRAQERLFGKLSKMEGVTSIYVGKTMLRLAGENINILGGTGGWEISKILSKLSSIEVITCEDSKNAEFVSKEMEKIVSSIPNLEILTEVNDNEGDGNSEHVIIYAIQKPDSDIIETILISVMGDDEPTLIALHGKLTPEDIGAAFSAGSNK